MIVRKSHFEYFSVRGGESELDFAVALRAEFDDLRGVVGSTGIAALVTDVTALRVTAVSLVTQFNQLRTDYNANVNIITDTTATAVSAPSALTAVAPSVATLAAARFSVDLNS